MLFPKFNEKASYDVLMSEEQQHCYGHEKGQETSPRRKGKLIPRDICFAISLTFNLVFIAILARSSYAPLERNVAVVERSQFAGLQRTVPRPWLPYDLLNDTEQDMIWENTSLSPGNVALDYDYAQAMGLPRAQRFPWDSSKGIYFLNGFHNMHCVMRLRQSLIEFRSGEPQSDSWTHIKHCLMVLRDEIMCDASDVPRYTGFQPALSSGLGQVRMCRDWAQLERWGREHSACWKMTKGRSSEGYKELDSYRFCPPGSPYEEMAKTAWVESPTASVGRS